MEKSAFPPDYPCGPLWRFEERQGSSTSRNAIVYRRVFAPLDRSCIVQEWFDFPALFSISLHFNADCTRHQVSRRYPSDVSLARSLSPVDFYLRRATNPMRNARLNTVKRREGSGKEGGQSSLMCARGGEAKPRAIDPGYSLPELSGQTFVAGNVYLGHSVREQITRNFCAIDVSGTECARSVQICVFDAVLRMKRKC